MRSLLDVNFLIAILDVKHSLNERAQEWWGDSNRTWASCPLTENAVVRILSNPNYDKRIQTSASNVIDQLNKFKEASDHEFWKDDISILDDTIFRANMILGARHLTDLYLLGLSAKNNGQLITFDTRISISAVATAGPDNIVVL